jgi:hypothetical protein
MGGSGDDMRSATRDRRQSRTRLQVAGIGALLLAARGDGRQR